MDLLMIQLLKWLITSGKERKSTIPLHSHARIKIHFDAMQGEGKLKAADSGYSKISSSSSYAGIQIALELDHLLFPVFV